MMDYTHEILTAMVDRYERRKGTSAQNGKPQRAVTFDLAKYYPIYRDHLSEEEQAIDDAVTRLSSWQMVAAPAVPRDTTPRLLCGWTTFRKSMNF